jgi:hypothetical protein
MAGRPVAAEISSRIGLAYENHVGYGPTYPIYRTGETLATIEKDFGMSNYSSVSSVFCRMNDEIKESASLRRRIEGIDRELQMGDLIPGPLYRIDKCTAAAAPGQRNLQRCVLISRSSAW